MLMIIALVVLIRWNIIVEGCSDLVEPLQERCYTCVCISSAACNDLFVCAKKTISIDYWRSAGEVIAGGEKNRLENDEENYKNCIKDKICILNTMHFYIIIVLQRLGDINCDGFASCADFFAIHNFGLNSTKPTSIPGTGISKRFDRCEGHGIVNVTNNWLPKSCQDLRLNKT